MDKGAPRRWPWRILSLTLTVMTLAVYNLLGQEVVTLVNKMKAAGWYTVTWNGRNSEGLGVASGVYLYRLISSTGHSETKRMTLLK